MAPPQNESTSTSTSTPTNEDPWTGDQFREICELWEIKAQDEQKLRILQAKTKDVKHSWNTPDVLLSFVEAVGWDKAEEKFRKMIQWRLDNDIDSLLTDYKPNRLILDNSPIAFLRDYDKDGDPIYVERGGAVDTKGLLDRFSFDELMRHAIWLREVQCSGEWIEEYERRQGRGIRKITVVYDLEGLSASDCHPKVLSFFQQLMQLTDDYYPGPIKRMVIIRAPTVFRFAWQTIKHFFSEESREQMIFAGSDYLEELSKYMDIDVLPPCINPSGHGETATGMPKNMDCGVIPAHIGPGGVGYNPPGSGVSEPSPMTAAPRRSFLKKSSSITESDTCSDSEGEELNASFGAVRVS